MLACQGVLCAVVRETLSGLPRVLRVTLRAICPQLSAVLVDVTVETLLAQAQVRSLERQVFAFEHVLRDDQLLRVALAAPGARMCTYQFPAGTRVLKIVLAVFPMNQFEVAANMLGMAFRTGAGLNFRRAMKTRSRLNSVLNCSMTG